MLPLFHAIGLIATFFAALPTDAVAARAKDKLPLKGDKTLGLSTLNVTVERVQRALKDAGYYKGRIDGRFNEETERAILEYESREGLTRNPVASKKLTKHIETNTKVQFLLEQLQSPTTKHN